MLVGLQKASTHSVNHLKRVVRVTAFTFQELSTLLTQDEACLNSHPLTALSIDPNNLMYLSPGNFWQGNILQIFLSLTCQFVCLRGRTCNRSNNIFGKVVHKTVSRICSKKANGPLLRWICVQAWLFWSKAHPGCDGLLQVATFKDNGRKHNTLHPQANDGSPHTKLDSKGCMFLVSLNRGSMLGVIMLSSNWKRYLCTFECGRDSIMQEMWCDVSTMCMVRGWTE